MQFAAATWLVGHHFVSSASSWPCLHGDHIGFVAVDWPLFFSFHSLGCAYICIVVEEETKMNQCGWLAGGGVVHPQKNVVGNYIARLAISRPPAKMKLFWAWRTRSERGCRWSVI